RPKNGKLKNQFSETVHVVFINPSQITRFLQQNDNQRNHAETTNEQLSEVTPAKHLRNPVNSERHDGIKHPNQRGESENHQKYGRQLEASFIGVKSAMQIFTVGIPRQKPGTDAISAHKSHLPNQKARRIKKGRLASYQCIVVRAVGIGKPLAKPVMVKVMREQPTDDDD